MTTPYFDELARRLRACGLPEEQVSRTVDDLAAFATESGTDPMQEFGTPEEFAMELAPTDGRQAGGAVPPVSTGTWTWRADAFHERDVLNRYGDEGWEVVRLDTAGRFVSQRDPENPQRWEYRRETVLRGRGQAVVDRLAPDGWEPCGTWSCFAYFKRPKAATIGPGADLRSTPDTPSGRLFWSKRFYVLVAAAYICCIAGTALIPDEFQTGFVTGVLAGVLFGGLVIVVAVTTRIWLARRRAS